MSAQVIRLREVGVYRDQSMLLRNVSWTVHDDETWVIIGPNGAGKTTLLQLAGGLLLPTQGSAEVLGERLATAGSSRQASAAGGSGGSPPRDSAAGGSGGAPPRDSTADLAELRSPVGLASTAV